MRGIGGTPPLPLYPRSSNYIGGPQAAQAHRATTVSGDTEPPCVVVMCIGEGGRPNVVAERARHGAREKGYSCLVIKAGTDLEQATEYVPEYSYVFLVADRERADEVATIRKRLPAGAEVIDEVNCEGVDLIDHDTYRALWDLPDETVPTAQELRSCSDWPFSKFPPPHGPVPIKSLRLQFEPIEWHETWMMTEGGGATQVLSDALDLDPDLCRSAQWHQFDEAPQHSLLILVNQALRSTENKENKEALKTMLRNLVQTMAAKPDLAKRVFGVLQGGDASCVDRVSFTLREAEEELLVQPIWEGALNQDLLSVVDIARKVFRRSCIDRLAEDKVNALSNQREELETHLAYIVGLHDSLELGGWKPDAMFISTCSGVTPLDLDFARRTVLEEEGEQEGKRLWEFLATWAPWQKVLGDLYPDEVTKIKEKLMELSDPEVWQKTADTEATLAGLSAGAEREVFVATTLGYLVKPDPLPLWLPLTMRALREKLG